MIVPTVLEVLVIVSAVIFAYFVAVWRVRKRLRPAALLLDERLRSLQGGGPFQTPMARGHFGGRPVSLLICLGGSDSV